MDKYYMHICMHVTIIFKSFSKQIPKLGAEN